MSRMRLPAAALAVALCASVVTGEVPAVVASAAGGLGPVAQDRPVPVHDVAARAVTPLATDKRAVRGPTATSWPAAGAADVAVSASGAPVVVGGLPVRVRPAGGGSAGSQVQAPSRVRVEVLGQRASAQARISGVLVRVSPVSVRAGGRVGLDIDYSAFAGAAGGDWASRLQVVRLPACALSGQSGEDCRGTVVRSVNDTRSHRITVEADVTGTVAITSGPSGSTGDFTATSLAPSGAWQVSTQSGTFGWSYPLRVPPVPGGQAPDLALSYSSGSVDGRTASTNSQPSWIGEGWDLWPGFVERRYKSCKDDGVDTGDLCWGPESVSLAFPGRSGELVRDDASGAYHPRDDDGSKVERLTGAANGGTGGEYWKVTTIDGTQYFFGLNHLPGWASGKAATNSAWTVPVFGNNPGEPCNQATFDASACDQVYRWNLDYVVDPHGNAMAFFYGTESNNYGQNLNKRGASYIRGGTLAKAVYGFRDGGAYGTPAAQVVFTPAERCITPGATCTPTVANQSNFPDTPLDQVCTGSPCGATQVSPAFFTTKRLDKVTTQVWKGTGYSSVDSWDLAQTLPDPGDATSASLWLASITHTGLVGGSLADPPVTFGGNSEAMPNRVDGLEGWSPMNKYRLVTIRTETGGQIDIKYADPDCVRTALPPAQDTNTKRCFPQWWAPPGEGAQLDWFHKYVVAQIVETDLVGSLSPPVLTSYSYVGGGAWHYTDTDELTPAAKRTWSQWRGYNKVVVTKGLEGETRSQSTYLYMRGMNGDKLTSGTRTASVTDSEGGTITDDPWLSGFLREEITHNGPGGAEVTGTINDPWNSAATATHTHDGLTITARLVRDKTQHGRVVLATGGVRRTTVTNTFDSRGLLTEVDDRGDTATATDDRCATTSYASDASRWMFSYPSEASSVAVACTATPVLPRDAISRARTYYDGSTTLGAIPGGGDATRTDVVDTYTGTTPHFLTASSGTYDTFGRPLTSTDALSRTTTTAYTDTGGLTTQTLVTNPAGHATTTTFEPAWDQATSMVDANNARTDLAYDALGRLTSVWKPTRPKSNFSPSLQFSYLIRNNAPSAVTTTSIGPNSAFTSSYTLYDGLLRPRQTQEPAATGVGRIITDVTYDTRGLEFRSNAPYYNPGAPGTTLVTANDTDVPTQTITQYDGVGRPTASIFRSGGVTKWQTTTSYGGDRVSVTPPQGGTATTTISDARGRTTELRQYQAPTPTGVFDATKYTYTTSDDLASVTEPAGNTWRYTYDLLGRQTSVEDPDKGTSTMTYDDAGQLLTTTDARGRTLAYTYDDLGRKTAEFDGSTSGTKLAEWVYDTLRKGYPTSSTRIIDGARYTTAIRGYNADGDVLGRSVVIPAVEEVGSLAGTYNDLIDYKPDGSVASLTFPITKGLANEGLVYSYNDQGLPTKLESSVASTPTLVPTAVFTQLGKPARFTLTGGSTTGFLSYEYEESTQRLTNTKVELGGVTTPTSNTDYDYDPAGNVTKIANTVQGGPTDTQCFTYDYLRRLSEAWTATDDCATAPSTSVLGGPAPYWNSYTYDLSGNRTSETQHDVTGATIGVGREYTYPAAGQPHPHAPTSVKTTSNGVEATSAYAYDEAGNTTSRPHAGNQQTLDWDAEGNLTSVTEAGQTTSYVYDGDGNRLLRTDATGTTLYLPSGVEVHLDTTGVTSTTRYYGFAGQTVAMRNSTGVSYLGADNNGTMTQQIAAAGGAVTTRRFDPFGNPRGAVSGSWQGDRGFVGGTTDATTGLTHLGAREYDSEAGRFISVDPILDINDPQSLNGYAYSNNSPITWSDPTGLSMGPINCGPDGFKCGSDPYHDPKTGAPRKDNDNDNHEVRDKGNASGSVPEASESQVKAAGVSMDSYKKAVANKKKDVKDVIKAIATQTLRDYFGIDDILNCFTEGDIWACASMVVSAVPILKLYKLGGMIKSLKKAWSAYQTFMKKRREANRILGKVASACPIKSSFVPGTLVLMADGSKKPIEKIKPGDTVLATDPKTGRSRPQVVVAALTSVGDKHLVQVTVDTDGPTGNNTATVTSTDNHPFWVNDPHPPQGPNLAPGHWTNATDLHPGDLLRTPTGTTLPVVALASYTVAQRVHNLTVDIAHTYNVHAGVAPLLVHNATPGQKCDLTLGPGTNAREGVALVDGDIDAPGVREMVDEAGAAHGCHTCGARTSGTPSGSWIPDHQPPTSLVPPRSPQTAFPHCSQCSRMQGGVVSTLSRGVGKPF